MLFEVREPRMEIEDFGRALLESGDLDPIYVMLHRAKLETNQLKRWLMAYWFFYHAGVASKLSEYEGEVFWGRALYHAEGKNAPRGTERRHFRGEKAESAIRWFRGMYAGPELAVDFASAGRTFQTVSASVKLWPQFGPWIAFKVADMLERVLGVPVDFSDCDLLSFYEEPRKAAEILVKRPGAGFRTDAQPQAAVDHLLRRFYFHKAPPSNNRPLNIQEVETILCKWKSHLNGHYPVGKDTREIRHALDGWGPLAERLKGCLPQ
jgi:hypothetical protein